MRSVPETLHLCIFERVATSRRGIVRKTKMAVPYVAFSSGATTKYTFDVGILIALPEELRYFLDVIREVDKDLGLDVSICSVESFWDEDSAVATDTSCEAIPCGDQGAALGVLAAILIQ